MRILISSHNKDVAVYFSASVCNIPALSGPHEIIADTKSDGLVAAVITGHPNGANIDLVIADDQMDSANNELRWSRILLERGLEPNVPFVLFSGRFDEKLKIEGVFPESVILLEPPFTIENLTKTMAFKITAAIAREEAGRSAAIEWLVHANTTTDISTAIDDLYMSSARRLNKYRQYAPWFSSPHIALGKVYAGCNRHKEAVPHLKTALSLDFNRQDAHRLLALCYRRTGQAFDELSELRKMLEADPASSDLLLRIGEADLREDNYESAMAHFKKAIENFKPSEKPRRKAKAHVGLGRAFFIKGEQTDVASNFGTAKTEFQSAVDADPTLIAAYNNLILTYRKLGMFAEAKKAVERAITVTPTEAEDWAELFEIYLADGDAGKARYALQKAVKLDPENQRILCSAGAAYIRQGMFREAVVQFETALGANPSDIHIYNNLGICHRRLLELDTAIKYYLTALKIEPDDKNIHFNLGKAYLQNNEREKAFRSFNKSLAIDPAFMEARKVLKGIKNYDAADQRGAAR